MSKRGGTKKELFGIIARLQGENVTLRNQRTTLIIAARLVLQNPTHDKNCWALQKNNPGPCTCYISDLEGAILKAEVQVQ